MNPVTAVQAQLEAYNRRDIDAFCALFAEEAQLCDLGMAAPSTMGKAAIRARYQQLFDNSPELHSALLSRTQLGRVVVDLETVTGRNGSADPFEVMAIYEVTGGLIVRVHFVRP